MSNKILKLNLGCGDKPLPGYVNLDAKHADVIYPLKRCYSHQIDSLTLSPGTVDEIRASHVLEHFPHNQTLAVLKDWLDYLKPGGVMKIAVPDFEKIADMYVNCKDRTTTEGYIMGGQSDQNDYHKSLFDTAGLWALMYKAGLRELGHWESEINDCASLPISLNLMGMKPHKSSIENHQSKIEVRVAFVMSVPRLAITNNVTSIYRAIAECGFTCRPAQGVFWHHGLTRQIEDRTAEGFEVLVAVDFDSWFLPGHVKRLLELLLTNPQADAVCAVQCEREGVFPIMGLRDESGEPVREIPRSHFEQPLTGIQIGHFGLTVFRASCFSKLKKPWFSEQPDPDGSWREGRRDADVAFWDNFGESGCRLFMANEVSIGHLQEVCTFPGPASNNWKPVHLYLRDLNAGRLPDHCRPPEPAPNESPH